MNSAVPGVEWRIGGIAAPLPCYASRGGALRGIARCHTWFREIDSALRIPCFLKALRPRLKCTAVLAARALRFVVSQHPKRLMNSAVPGVEWRIGGIAAPLPCYASRGGALRGIARCHTWFREIDSALRIPCFLKALRPRLKCTAVLAARALRFVVSQHPKRLMNSAVPGVRVANWGNCRAPTITIGIAAPPTKVTGFLLS